MKQIITASKTPRAITVIGYCLLVIVLAACSGDGSQMRAQLEELERQNRADSVMTNDSLAELLVKYFDRHGTPNERMRAHYILGRKEAEEERKKLEEEKRLAEQARKEEEARKKRRKDIWDEIEYNVYGVIAAAAMFLLLILYRKLGAGLFNEPVIPVHGLLRLILVVIAIGGTAYSALMMLMGILSAVGLEELSAVPAGLLALALAVGLKNQPKILAGLNYAALAGAALNLIILLIKLAKHRKK